jgi:hypothetical protein
LVLLLAVVGTADAASTAALRYGGKSADTTIVLGDASANDISATRAGSAGPTATWTLADRTGMSSTSPECSAVDTLSVRCPVQTPDGEDYEGLRAFGEGGDDRIRVTTAAAGTTASALLDGGAGDDRLSTGPGVSAVFDLTPGNDTIDDENGDGELSVYRESTVPVIDLRSGTATGASGTTTMHGVENVNAYGDAWAHGRPLSVTADDAANFVSMKGGTAVLGGGADRFLGSGRVSAGPGNDSITTMGPSRIACGTGRDVVDPHRPGATVGSDCEWSPIWNSSASAPEAGSSLLDPRPHRLPGARRHVRFRVRCTAQAPTTTGCSGAIRLSLGTAKAKATTSFRVRAGHDAWVRVRTPRNWPIRVGTGVHVEVSTSYDRAGTRSWRPWTAPVVR